MSEVRSRPRVSSVRSDITLPVATGCTLVAAGLLAVFVKSLSSAGRSVFEACSASKESALSNTIAPLSDVSREFLIKETQWIERLSTEHKLDITEAKKLATLLSVASSSFVVDASEYPALKDCLDAFCKAYDGVSSTTSRDKLLGALRNGHCGVFAKAVSLACTNAALTCGFDSHRIIQTSPNILRQVSTDTAGRSLVTEIEIDQAGELTMTTEILGVSDGTCHRIMDKFDSALEEQGIKSGLPVRRNKDHSLGLKSVREFLERGIRKPSLPGGRAVHKSTEASRRAQKLNVKSSSSNRGGRR